MNELVFLQNEEPFTTSLVIAEGTDNQHKSVVRLINEHSKRIERWGQIRFSDLKSTNPLGGRPTKVAYLNEQQATFLITLLKNNDIVLDFKAELVDQFFKMRQALQQIALQRPLIRQSTKITQRKVTDAIKEYVIPNARANGSTAPDKVFYMTYNKLFNKVANIPAGQRDTLTISQLIMLDQKQDVAAANIRIKAKRGEGYREIYSGTKNAVEGYAQIALVQERLQLK